MIRTCLAIAVLLATVGRAAAEDNASTGDTVVSTWTGAGFQLAESDKRFNLAIASLIQGIQLRAEASAPIDSDTRTATFFSKSGITPAFRAALHIGYDSDYQDLALAPGDAEVLAYCEAHDIKVCATTNIRKQRNLEGQVPAAEAWYWRLGFDASYAYDQMTAYTDDVGSAAATFRATDLQLGGSAMIYAPGGWVVSLRGGYERSNTVNVGDFMRCTSLPSSDPAVTGQSCNEAHYLISNPDPEQTGYARLAGTYYPEHGQLANYLSATELRVNLENLGSDAASFDLHGLVFAKGLDLGAGNVRIGVGTTVRFALSPPAGTATLYDYSLFGIAGTSF